MNKLTKVLGIIWASPVTFFGLVYALLFWAFRWYRWDEATDVALVWSVNDDKAPAWLKKKWEHWGGHCIGNVIVLNTVPSTREILLKHESKHVDQCMRLGVFDPIVYVICLAAIKWGCPGSDAYLDHPFEIDARRAAGQLIDITGAIKRAKETQKS